MDYLQTTAMIRSDSRRDLLGNRLVLIAHDRAAAEIDLDKGFDLAGLLGEGRLAMALVDSVPAGVYGKQALSSLGLWESVEDKVAQTDNVRAALALVSSGEAPYGIVYVSDAIADARVKVVAAFPQGSHASDHLSRRDRGGVDRARCRRILFLSERSGGRRKVFRTQGFTPLSGRGDG
jgi:molybdate transport system substrate-binding protein